LPSDWNAWRTQWETGHAIRFVLHLIAFVLLAFSLTSERTTVRVSGFKTRDVRG
jgi:hypothetical protein